MNETARFLRRPTVFRNDDGRFTLLAWIVGGTVAIFALIAIMSVAGNNNIQTASLDQRSATELGFGGSR